MPNLRERSKIVPPKIFQIEKNSEKKKRFSYKEKTHLLIFLKRYGVDKILNDPHTFFPTKTFEEINNYFNFVKNRKFSRIYEEHYLATKTKDSTEIWLETIKSLSSSVKDNSNIIAEVVSRISKCEEFDSKSADEDPNWTAIYNYLSAALNNHDLPILTGIDASVVLQLIEDLLCYKDSLQLDTQTALLTKKLALLLESQSEEDNLKKLQLVNKALLLETQNEIKAEIVGDNCNSKTLQIQNEPLYYLNPLNIPIRFLKPEEITVPSGN